MPQRSAGADPFDVLMRADAKGSRAAPVIAQVAPTLEVFQTYVASRRASGRPVVLDLGCGRRKAPGAFGVDVVPLPAVDLVHDLQRVPYPLPYSCADEIHLVHVLEHFSEPLPILQEAWRLARPGGTVRIRTPHYSGVYAWKDPTHRRAFSAESFQYFGENDYSYYTDARFRVKEARLKYFLEEQYWPWPHRVWGRIVQRVLDSHPTFAERFLCYWVGGIDEIQVALETVKP
jgi:SAM-dependent methyltransferase